MFSYIKKFFKNILSAANISHIDMEDKEEVPSWQDVHPYSGDSEDGDPVLTIIFTLTDKGVVLIDLENNTRQFEPIELASLISYIGSLRGQMDALDIIKEGMYNAERKEDHEQFLGCYVSLRTQEAEALQAESQEAESQEDDTPCIIPSEMMP